MGGGLMQLVAYGAQDIYLTAMETVEQTINGTVAASARTTCTISRNGDLIHDVFVKATRNSSAVRNEMAVDLDNVEVQVGGQMVDKHYGHWLEVWAELTQNTTGRQLSTEYSLVTGTCEGVVCDNDTSAADSGTETSVIFFNGTNVDSRVVYMPLQFWFCRNPGLSLPLIALQYHEVKLIFTWASTLNAGNHSVWANYVYLDTDERRRFAQVSHEYLIEQVQFQDQAEATTHTLTFNHPVKEIIWTGGWSGGAVVPLRDLNDTAKIKLNGHDRMAAMPLTYFTGYQPMKYHTGCGLVDNSIAVYSFALKPEEHQPSGTCNLSRIDTAQLVLSNEDAIYVYVVNYNVLRIMSGMGGLAYSN
jgi:hypothetical protein